MENVKKLRKEIEKQINDPLEYCYGISSINKLREILAIIDSWQEEPPKELEEEIVEAGKDVIRQAHYHNKIFHIPQTMFDDVQLMDIFKSGVYKGYELGKNSK